MVLDSMIRGFKGLEFEFEASVDVLFPGTCRDDVGILVKGLGVWTMAHLDVGLLAAISGEVIAIWNS